MGSRAAGLKPRRLTPMVSDTGSARRLRAAGGSNNVSARRARAPHAPASRQRGSKMKNACLGATAALVWSAGAAAQSTPPEIPFDSVANFLQLPQDTYLGEVAGIAVNSN